MPQVIEPHDNVVDRHYISTGLGGVLGNIAADAADRGLAKILPRAQENYYQSEADAKNLATNKAKILQALETRQRLKDDPNAPQIAAKSVGWDQNNPALPGYSAPEEATSQASTNISQSPILGLPPLSSPGGGASAPDVSQAASAASGAASTTPLPQQPTSSPVAPSSAPLTQSAITAAPPQQTTPAPPAYAGGPTDSLIQAAPQIDPIITASASPEARGQAVQALAQNHASMPLPQQQQASQAIQQALILHKSLAMLAQPLLASPDNIGLLSQMLDTTNNYMANAATLSKIGQGQSPFPPGYNYLKASAALRLNDQAQLGDKAAQAQLKDPNSDLMSYLAPTGPNSITANTPYPKQSLEFLRSVSGGVPAGTLADLTLSREKLAQESLEAKQNHDLAVKSLAQNDSQFRSNFGLSLRQMNLTERVSEQKLLSETQSVYVDNFTKLKHLGLEVNAQELFKQSQDAVLKTAAINDALNVGKFQLSGEEAKLAQTMQLLMAKKASIDVANGYLLNSAQYGLNLDQNGKDLHAAAEDMAKKNFEEYNENLKAVFGDKDHPGQFSPAQVDNVINKIKSEIKTNPAVMKADAGQLLDSVQKDVQGLIPTKDREARKHFSDLYDQNPDFAKVTPDTVNFDQFKAMAKKSPDKKLANSGDSDLRTMYQYIVRHNAGLL